jgi:predicted glycogen debranching enzyme
MLKVLQDIYTWHKSGTLYGIKVDPNDGLLTQGERGVQLTWMDAKVGDWVVTPRHGKPVEVNGLWINMLRILEWLCGKLKQDPTESKAAAEQAETSFEAKFFHEGRGHYVDTVDPLDVSLRPNQVIAMALPFGPAKGARAKKALKIVKQELLTPRGLRTLGPKEAGYRGRYEGPLPQMDAAYHQGTAWPWLLGQYATAVLSVNGDKKEAKAALDQATEMLKECGLGGIAEVYDGNEPQHPNGCPWQAWSVGELLRAMSELEA